MAAGRLVNSMVTTEADPRPSRYWLSSISRSLQALRY
jgi:hypothetical protein